MTEKKDKPEELSPVKRALVAMQKMRARIEDLEYARTEPIAVVGVGIRFPGSVYTKDDFWKLLDEGVDAIREVPPERYSLDEFYDADTNAPGKVHSKWGGFLDQVDEFDAEFFGINPREATNLDPQQRLMLEVAYEAFQDAGYTLNRLSGSRTGVYVGVYSRDYGQLTNANLDLIDPYTSTGDDHGFGPNRVSYFFNLHGPSIPVNALCSSSLVGIHLGANSLRTGECDMVLAGGVNLQLTPGLTLGISKLRALSPDGRCKTFDSRANGFVRGEGCGLVVLKRLSDAERDGDRILGVVRGSAVNQDGRGNGLTQPNMQAQKTLLSDAIRVAGIDSGDLDYIETHGTGTELGDPIEVEAISSVVNGKRERPLVLGAVKSNIGHLETAAGAAGFIKVLLALKHQRIPANLHFQKLNPHITLDEKQFQIPVEPVDWPAVDDTPRYAGVSSFGMGGTNAHMILSDAPEATIEEKNISDPAVVGAGADTPLILTISGHNPEALRLNADRYREFLTRSEAELEAICYNALVYRDQHRYRMAVVGHAKDDVVAALEKWMSAGEHPRVVSGENDPRRRRKPVFAFAGLQAGAPEANRMSELLSAAPAYRETIEDCDAIIQKLAGWSLLEAVESDPTGVKLQNKDTALAVSFSHQFALLALLQSFEIQPAAVVGHDAGEAAAAHAAGILSLEEALTIAYHCGRLSNGGQLLSEAELGEFTKSLGALSGKAGRIPFYSGLIGELLEGEKANARHWAAAVSQPGKFTQAITRLVENDQSLFVEISSRETFADLLDRGASENAEALKYTIGDAGLATILTTLGALHCQGVTLRLERLYANPSPHIDLPLYAWTRQRFWIDVEFQDAVYGGAIQRTSAAASGGQTSAADQDAEWDRLVAGASADEAAPLSKPQLLVLSSDNASALEGQAGVCRDWLKGKDAGVGVRALTATAALHQEHYSQRMTVVGSGGSEMAELLDEVLAGGSSPFVSRGEAMPGTPRTVFVFSGQGSQWPQMARDLLEQEPVFRAKLDEIESLLGQHADWSLIEELNKTENESRLGETEIAQPAIFALQVGLVAVLSHYGIKADALAGHSVGEVAAAHVSGALDLESAVRVIYHRALVMQKATGLGRMAAAGISSEDAQPYIAGKEDRVAVGAHNSPDSVVFSGEEQAVQEIFDSLPDGAFKMMLPVNYAFHSPIMEPFKAELEQAMSGLSAQAPAIPVYSTVTGELVEGAQFGADYWPRNMREAVAFAPVIDSIARESAGTVFVEIGAHNVLSVPVEQCLAKAGLSGAVVPTLRRNMDSFRMTLAAIGRLYAAGVDVNWGKLFEGAGDAQLRPPVAPVSSAPAASADGESLVDWMYQLEWSEQSVPDEVRAAVSHWLILCDTRGVGQALAELAEAAGQQVVMVFPGDAFEELDRGQYSVRPNSQTDFNKLRDTLIQTAPESQFTVVHLWATDSLAVEDITVDSLEEAHQRVLMSAARLIQSQHSVPSDHRPRVRFVTQGVQSLNGETPAALVESTLWGFARAVAAEHPLAWGGLIDLETGLAPADAARTLYAEFQNGSAEDYVCVREGRRYVARMAHVKPAASQGAPIDAASGYLITGGLTGIGLLVARWLIQKGATHLTLLGRTPLPDRSEWDGEHKESVLERIKAVQHLEALGATIVTAAVDTSSETQFTEFLESYASEKHPAIKGVIHSAGVLEGRSVMDLDADSLRKVLQPKVDGGWVLHKCLSDVDLDFFVLFSSVSGTVTGLADGLANYAAANSFLDYLAAYRRSLGLPATSVIWGPWADTGFAAQSETGNRMIENLLSRGIHSLSSRRGLRILDASITSDVTAPIAIRIDWDRFYKTMRQAAVSPLYADLVAQPSSAPSVDAGQAAAAVERAADGALTLQHLAEVSEDEREKMLQTYMARHVAEIMRYPIARLDVNRPLKEIGIDSLMGVELRNRIQNDLDYELSAARIVDGSSIAQLASFVIKNLELPFAAAGQQYEEAPLSAEQEGVFFLSQLAPQVSVANVHSAYLLDPEFDAAAIASGLGDITERYEVLRTAIVSKTGVATRLVFQAAAPDFKIVDMHSIDEEEIFDLLSRETEIGFELSEAPLLRVRLYPLESGAHILLAVAHSIALDEESLKKICRELLQTAAGQAPGDTPHSFQEYAQQRAARSEADVESDRAFWCEYLKGDLPAMRLPVTRSIPPLQTYRAETIGFDLTEDVVSGMEAMGGLEAVILAAYAAMLSRVTGHGDVPVGLYLRLPDADENIAGPLTNLVILRANVAGDSSFADFIGQVDGMLQDIRKHGAFPFRDIIRETNPLRDPARSPVVPFTVNFIEPRDAALEELGVDALDLDKTETFDEVAVLCSRGPDGVRLEFRFKAELYSSTTMEQFASSLNTLLQAAVADPKRTIAEIDFNPIPIDEQIQNIWQENPDSTADEPRENALLPSGDLRTPVLHELVDDVANMVPGAMAILSGKRRMSYSELSEKADQLAQFLLAKNLKPGSAIVLCLARSPEFLISVLGVLKAGHAVVPLDPAYSIARLNIFLNDSKAKLMLTLEHYEERFEDSKVELVLLDKETKNIFKKRAKKKPIPEYDPEATAFVFYSTKNKVIPLGTEVDHKAFTHSLKYYVQSSSLGLGARTLHYNSVNSLVAYYEVFATLVTGGSLILRSKKDRHDSDLVKFMQEQYVERIFVAQSLLRGISRVSYEQDLAPRYLREINLIGDRISVTQQLIEMLEKLGYCEVNYRFTLLETGTFSNYRLADLRSGDWPDYLPIGRPIDGTQMYILDDRMRPVPVGFIGELYVAGSSLAKAYRGHPAATKERFLKDPFSKKKGARMYKTGMLARFNLNGQIQLVGSEERSAVYRGRSMNLREIELIIEEHPAIAEAYVTQNKDLGANGLLAFIVSDRIVDRLITTIYCHVEYENKDKITLVTQDVSSGGLRLQGIPSDWKVGMELRMTLLLPGFFDEFRVQGEVKWVRQGQAGVEFNTSPVEESMLKKSLAYLLELEQFTMAHESQMPRVPIRRRCSVELETGQRIELTASEISTSGISVLDAPDSWEIGKKVYITLNLPGIIEPPRMLCTLAWRDKKNRTGFNFDPNQEARERLHEFIMHFKEHQQLSITQLRSFLQTRLAYYLIPTSFVILSSLPEFPDGTINDSALRAPDNNYYEAELTYVTPRTSIEGVIQTVWVDVLSREYATVGIYNNFFDLGGDSLLAIVAVSRISEELDIDLPVRSLYLAPTISELGKIVLQRKAQREKDLALDEALKELENLSQDDLKQIVRSQLLEEEEG